MIKWIKHILVFAAAAISVLYLFNPTAGFLELIPDNAPIVGNLDEAGAVILLLNCLRYFGIDLTRIISGDKKKNTPGQ